MLGIERSWTIQGVQVAEANGEIEPERTVLPDDIVRFALRRHHLFQFRPTALLLTCAAQL